jgi:RDD family
MMFNLKKNNLIGALARFCDYSIFYLTLGVISLFIPCFYGPSFYYLLALAVPFLWAPIEAFFISKWGTTPGKALLGLEVKGTTGRNLPYSAALKRAFFFPGRSGILRQKKISWKRQLCALATGATFALAALFGNALTLWSIGLEKGISPERWVEYASDDTGFKISFPTPPETISKELVIPDSGKVLPYEEITCDENKVYYSVSRLNLPRKWRLAADATLLKGVLDQLVKHTPNSVLLKKDFKMYNNHRVLDFHMSQGKGELEGRLIVVGGTLYKLTVLYPPSHSAETEKNLFLNSFEAN